MEGFPGLMRPGDTLTAAGVKMMRNWKGIVHLERWMRAGGGLAGGWRRSERARQPSDWREAGERLARSWRGTGAGLTTR